MVRRRNVLTLKQSTLQWVDNHDKLCQHIYIITCRRTPGSLTMISYALSFSHDTFAERVEVNFPAERRLLKHNNGQRRDKTLSEMTWNRTSLFDCLVQVLQHLQHTITRSHTPTRFSVTRQWQNTEMKERLAKADSHYNDVVFYTAKLFFSQH